MAGTEPLSDEEYERVTKEHIEAVRVLVRQVMRQLLIVQVLHDETKLVDPERDAFKEFSPKLAGCTYGSPEYHEMLKGLQHALDHHYANNRHHPEHFKDGVDGMTLIDLIELICDWTASTKRHNDGDIMKSIEVNTKRFNLSPQLANVLRNTVLFLGWVGDDNAES